MPSRSASIVLGVLGIGAVALGAPARAALPDWIQWHREISTVLSSQSVYGPFVAAKHAIVKVERVGVDLYRVSSHDVGRVDDQDCTMDVKIETDPAHRPAKGATGARHFVVVPGALECRPAR